MTKIVVTGGAGFLGDRLIRRLLDAADNGDAPLPFDQVVSLDLVPSRIDDRRVESVVGDLSDAGVLRSAVTADTAAVYHLAAVLSGGSASDFDLSMRVNVDGTRHLLEAARASGGCPKFIFTSSLAVFGGQMPEVVTDQWAQQPDSTYGAFKAVGELLVNEYSRKNFIDGRICRLPTISVRPGKPNSAASSFASGIIREPLAGVPTTCPVPHDTRMWLSSPESAVTNLVHALEVSADHLGQWRGMNIPGISVTVGEMLATLERVGGAEARHLVTDEPDAEMMEIVCSWPGDFQVQHLLELGFVRDESFDDVVRQYQEEFVS